MIKFVEVTEFLIIKIKNVNVRKITKIIKMMNIVLK